MTRIPSHSVADAPEASRSLLEEMIQFSPTGQPLNMHAQMAHSPAVLSMLALRSGWRRDEVDALRAGKDLGDPRTDALVGLVRTAAEGQGRVSDAAWADAVADGWTDEQLAEAFASLGLAVFTAYFLNYAATELDLPAGR